MKLMTKELERSLPKPRSQEHVEDPVVRAKFFNPAGAATWYVLEYDPASRECFGFVDLGDPDNAELGYFTLDELEGLRVGPGGCLGIERDRWFKPAPLSECKAKRL
jgi:hypothetical protein